MNIYQNDIVLANNKIVQYLGKESDNGAIIQDVHCLKELIHVGQIIRKARTDETKWFCENTENAKFVPPTVVTEN